MDKKFCHNCGAELDADARFCTKCASPCEQPSAPMSNPEPSPITQYNMSVQKKSALGKIDIKQTLLSNIIPIVCLVIGLILVFTGTGINVPSTYISSYSMTEYVGGDAYNFIIEACLRGGEIAAAQAGQYIYIGIGLLIACMSALKIKVVKAEN